MKNSKQNTYQYTMPNEERQIHNLSINQNNSSYNEQHYNDKYPNFIKLSDIDEERKSKLIEENESLSYQNQNLNNEINILNQALTQAKTSNFNLQEKLTTLQDENRNMKDEISMLQSSNDDLKNKLNMLSLQNSGLNNVIGEQKNHLNMSINEKNAYINEIKKLNELLEKYKSISDNNVRDRQDADRQKNMYYSKYQQNERDKDNLLYKNNQMNDMLIKNQSMINRLQSDNNGLNRRREFELESKNAIIRDLRSQIDFLKDDLSKCHDNTTKIQNYYINERKNNQKKIDNLSELLGKKNEEYDKLNKSYNENKRLNNKLMDEHNNLTNKSNNLYKNKKIKEKSGSPRGGKNNFNPSTPVKGIHILDEPTKERQMLFELIKFVNELNDYYDHPQIGMYECYNNLNKLTDDINELKKNIYNPKIENETYNKYFAKKKRWDDTMDKLLAHDNEYSPEKYSNYKIWKNASLKRPSPNDKKRDFIAEYRYQK